MSIYRDVNAFNPTEKPLLEGVEVVYQSLNNIFNTLQGERLFRPQFPGEELEGQLFEFIDDLNAFAILRIVTNAITNNEPRVTVLTSLSTVKPDAEKNRYQVVLYFKIEGFSDQNFQLTGNLSQ